MTTHDITQLAQTRLGRIAMTLGLISSEQLEEALITQEAEDNGLPLGYLLSNSGLIDDDQLKALLAAQRSMRCGDALPEPAPANTATGRWRFGPYEVLAEISSGASGTVYRARHRGLDRIVALKLLDPALARDRRVVRRFVQEGRALATLRHPGVVEVYNVGRIDGRYFIEMEYVPGRDLSRVIAEDGPLSVERALDVLTHVGQALEAAWSRGIVHRDVKPGNILLADDGGIKLTDFGISKASGRRNTARGHVLGTPSYMAPEQAAGCTDIDHRADIYALGATLLSMLTGRPPFSGATPLAVMNRQLTDELPTNDRLGIPDEVYLLVDQMMQKRPSLRPGSCMDIQRRIATLGTRMA